jgi:hypothetical protein
MFRDILEDESAFTALDSILGCAFYSLATSLFCLCSPGFLLGCGMPGAMFGGVIGFINDALVGNLEKLVSRVMEIGK